VPLLLICCYVCCPRLHVVVRLRFVRCCSRLRCCCCSVVVLLFVVHCCVVTLCVYYVCIVVVVDCFVVVTRCCDAFSCTFTLLLPVVVYVVVVCFVDFEHVLLVCYVTFIVVDLCSIRSVYVRCVVTLPTFGLLLLRCCTTVTLFVVRLRLLLPLRFTCLRSRLRFVVDLRLRVVRVVPFI